MEVEPFTPCCPARCSAPTAGAGSFMPVMGLLRRAGGPGRDPPRPSARTWTSSHEDHCRTAGRYGRASGSSFRAQWQLVRALSPVSAGRGRYPLLTPFPVAYLQTALPEHRASALSTRNVYVVVLSSDMIAFLREGRVRPAGTRASRPPCDSIEAGHVGWVPSGELGSLSPMVGLERNERLHGTPRSRGHLQAGAQCEPGGQENGGAGVVPMAMRCTHRGRS
jgi:hypothetical protein